MPNLEEALDPQANKIDDLQRENKRLVGQVERLGRERAALNEALSLVEQIAEAEATPPRWMSPKKASKGHVATACLLITDTHFDEVVDAASVDGINAYDRAIAEIRLRAAFEGSIVLARDYLRGVKYDGISLFFGGDIFSGNIHDELRRTNMATLFESLLHYLGPMEAGIEMLAEEFGKVHVSGVPGNHGRSTMKPIHKDRATDNLDWLFYSLLARDFRDDPRVTFQIPVTSDCRVSIYDTTFLLMHGDDFHGGSGIAGALSPMMLGSHRTTRQKVAAGKPYDIMVLGHFHQRISLPARGLLAGAALKGYDEYAYNKRFEPEREVTQEFWITTPEHGVTFSAPVIVSNRKKEGW